jgi:hypothetical protein
MKNIHLNKNNFQKNRLTELPITIVTDDEHKDGDRLELARQRIERAALYLMSVFNVLKTCALASEGQADNKEVATFCGDVMNHCDIGYGISDSILTSASCLTEFQPDETESDVETKQPTDAISPDYFTNLYKRTGERIERVLVSDKVSNEVKNILEALVNEAANEAGFSFPETDEIALKLPKIFGALGKSKDSFVVYYNAIETALNHGTNEKEI